MKYKTAKRFLFRNQHKLAQLHRGMISNKKMAKQEKKCINVILSEK